MRKYVELEDVIQRLDNAIYCANTGEFDSYLEAMKRLRIAYAETMPTIDIVWCEECKWSDPNQEGDYDCKCRIPIFRVDADGWCYLGEREEE